MTIRSARPAAFAAALLALGLHPVAAQTLPGPPDSPMIGGGGASLASAPPASYADLTMGGYAVLRLRGSAGGLSPAGRIGVIESRLTPLLGIPNIRPSDVVVYLPDPKSHINRAPVLYALGRRLITVDPATIKAAGGGDALTVATKWARRLQQVLPRVNWRPPNVPEPKVPAHPPLLITRDFTQVGGQTGLVALRGKTIMKMRGVQPGGMTAAERGDLLTARLEMAANRPEASAPDAVKVVAGPGGTASLSLAGMTLVSVGADDARLAGFQQPSQLANAWAKNLRAALPTPVPAPAPTPPAPAEAAPTPPTPTPAPTPPAPTPAPPAPAPAPPAPTP